MRYSIPLWFKMKCTLGLLFIMTALAGCATNQTTRVDLEPHQQADWMSHILEYERSIKASDPIHLDNLFEISDEVKQKLHQEFIQRNKHQRAKALAEWILDESGLEVEYDVDANLPPRHVLVERRANCLSFTMLLVTLARELDVELQYNDVDIPNTWDLNEENEVVFYRHVNAVYKTPRLAQVFDLAMDEYDSAFPQRVISERSAAAMLHSNWGIEALRREDYKQAAHHAKLSVSLDPNNSYLWINLGVITKRSGDLDVAEKIFKTALEINDFNSFASSNLERLYRQMGKHRLAEKFRKRAMKARANNPYYQYDLAKLNFKSKNFRAARKSINQAIRLHDQDPKFFELRSRLNQHFKRYRPALLDLEKAFQLAKNLEDRGRYYRKVKQVAKNAEKEAERRRQLQRQRNFELTPSRGFPNNL